MKSKTKTETKPIYSAQIEGAAGNISSAYNTQAPKISAITDQLGELTPGLLEKYTTGDRNVNAASDYNAKVLGGDYLTANPFIDQMVAQTNDSTRNGLAASLGLRRHPHTRLVPERNGPALQQLHRRARTDGWGSGTSARPRRCSRIAIGVSARNCAGSADAGANGGGGRGWRWRAFGQLHQSKDDIDAQLWNVAGADGRERRQLVGRGWIQMTPFAMPRGMFAARPPYATTGIGDGLAAPQLPEPPAYQRPSTGRMIVGGMGDVLQQWAGGRPTFAPAMQAQRQAAQEAAQYQRQRADQFTDWRDKQDYTRANPAPAAPYRFTSNDGDVYEMGPDGQPKRLFDDPTPKMQYITAKDPTTGQTIITPVPMGGTSPAGPPPGVTFTPIGGGAGLQTPRPFR